MPNYTYFCPKCNKGQEKMNRIASMHTGAPMCGWCNKKTKIRIQATPMLGRQKPGTGQLQLDRKLSEGNGDASCYHSLRSAENMGGKRWRGVKEQTSKAEIKQHLEWGKANGQ